MTQLQTHLDQLARACRMNSISTLQLLRQSYSELIAFSGAYGIDEAALREILSIYLEQLDLFAQQLKRHGRALLH